MKPIRPRSRHPRGLSRRDFLCNGSTGLATALLARGLVALAIERSRAAGESGMDMQNRAGPGSRGVPRAPFHKGAPLIETEVRRSVSGELRTTLQVRYVYKDIGGYRLSLRSYEGMIPGPTLRVRPGDVLRIRLINDLPPNLDPVPLDMALPHHFNTTNFHFHGSHVNDTVWPEAVPRFLSVNGQREPVIRMRPGEVQRWRIVHAGHENNLHIALEKHALHAIGFDGIRRTQVGRTESLLMAPGQRADVLVQAGAIGSYALAAIANDQG
jgi:FtsP/CotA-like multicopper oxidase with cupredoxin domain